MIFSHFSSFIEVLTSVSLFSFDCSFSLEISAVSISLDFMYISILFSSELSVPLSALSVLSFTSVLLSSFSESQAREPLNWSNVTVKNVPFITDQLINSANEMISLLKSVRINVQGPGNALSLAVVTLETQSFEK
jgi:hypothetical protein